MIWVVLDTNVLLKGFLSNINPSRKIINLALEGKIVIAGSVATMDEFEEKLYMERFRDFYERQKFSPEMLLNTYQNVVTLVEIGQEVQGLSICRDVDDDEFIRVAIQKDSKIVVTEDKDLLDIGRYENVRFIRPKKFIEIYEKLSKR